VPLTTILRPDQVLFAEAGEVAQLGAGRVPAPGVTAASHHTARARIRVVTTVDPVLVVVVLIALALAIGVGVWAMRFQNRQFPKGWDRTGWRPGRGAASWMATKFTWLSGGRG
jgi:hypothetical protein